MELLWILTLFREPIRLILSEIKHFVANVCMCLFYFSSIWRERSVGFTVIRYRMFWIAMICWEPIFQSALWNSDCRETSIGEIFAIFWPKLTVLRVLTYNFHTQLWIFLIFDMELLWIFTLSGEPIIPCLVWLCKSVLFCGCWSVYYLLLCTI